jgi:hypothetical protein
MTREARMGAAGPERVLGAAGVFLGKFLISVAALWMLVFALHLARSWSLASVEKARPVPTQAAAPSEIAEPDAKDVFWPHFPASVPPKSQELLVDGVNVVTESWITAAAPSEVLDYYKRQMMARGWEDVTEASFSATPDLPDIGEGRVARQDSSYQETYETIIESNLILRRGEWTMRVLTEDGESALRSTKVSIFAASTPSLFNFAEEMKSAFSGKAALGGANQAIDVTENVGRNRYHTTVVSNPMDPHRAFQEALRLAGSQGWQAVMIVPREGPRFQGGDVAWLMRGKDYAVLVVKALRQGEASSVMFTEVSAADVGAR